MPDAEADAGTTKQTGRWLVITCKRMTGAPCSPIAEEARYTSYVLWQVLLLTK